MAMTNSFSIDSSCIDTGLISIFNELPCVVTIKNANSIYVAGNQRLATLVGFKHSDEIIGLSDAECRCPSAQYPERFIELDKATLFEKDQRCIDIYPYADGNYYVFSVSRKKFIDNKDRAFILITALEVPIKNKIQLLTFLDQYEHKYNPELSGTIRLNSPFINGIDIDSQLTERQAECLYFLIRGKSSREIAELLHRSVRTVEEHIDNLKNQFQCKTKAELVDRAFEMGFAKVLPPSLLMAFL
jgi:DNA-binding CsgD family transcriptional regulator